MDVDASMFREYDIRGFVDQNFTEEVLAQIGKAYGTFLASLRSRGQGADQGPGTLAVGRDVRTSSARYARALIEGLRSTGADVVDVGQVPTPLVYFAVNHLHTEGGAAVTASHNPPQYNGLKLRKREPDQPNGLPLLPHEIQEVHRLAQEGPYREAPTGALREQDVVEAYVSYVKSRIKLARRMKVVVDAGNGVAGPVATRTLAEIGCDVVPLYCEPDGTFPNHMPDPLKPENLRDLIAKVKETGADLGIALDGDGERRELGVADHAAERLLGLEHPGGRPAQAHVAVLPALDVAAGGAADADHRLDRVRRGQRLPQLGMDAQALQRDRLGQALAQRRGRAGVRVRELAGERLQPLDRRLVIGQLPGRAQPPLDGGPVALGEVIEHVAFLVAHAALDGDVAEDGVDGGPQRLAAVHDDEHAQIAVQAALDEV